MRGFRPDDPRQVTLARLDYDALPEQYLFPPSAERQEFEKTRIGDMVYHESDLIQVRGNHQPGTGLSAAANDAAHPVKTDLPQRFEQTAHEGSNLVFISRNAVRFGQAFKQFSRLIHLLTPHLCRPWL